MAFSVLFIRQNQGLASKDLSFRATIFQLHHRIRRKMSGLCFGSGTEVVNLPTKLVCNKGVPKRRFRMCGNEHCPCCRVNYDKLKGKTCWLPGFATRGPIVAPIKFMIAPCVSILCVCVCVGSVWKTIEHITCQQLSRSFICMLA